MNHPRINGRQIRTQLAEKRLKMDSSPLDYEIAPTGPRPAHCVSRCSRGGFWGWGEALPGLVLEREPQLFSRTALCSQ